MTNSRAPQRSQHLTDSQAFRIIQKFGGVKPLARLLERIGRPRDPCSMYKWLYPAPKGRGGLIPLNALNDIMYAARVEGVVITSEDLDYRPTHLKDRFAKNTTTLHHEHQHHSVKLPEKP